MSSSGTLVIYVQENSTNSRGKKTVDFAGFVARRHGAYVLDFTRTPADEADAVAKLSFPSLWHVREFINSVVKIDRKDKHGPTLTAELHIVPEYNAFVSFTDLWRATGANTEVAAFDSVNRKQLDKMLQQLDNVRNVDLLYPHCHSGSGDGEDEE